MWLFLALLLPILISGIIILRKTTSLVRMELLLPTGSILGLAIYTLFLNTVAFFLKGSVGIVTAYLLTILSAITVFKYFKKIKKIEISSGRQLLFWLISILGWGVFIWWKTSYALIGSDTNLYYSIAHSFIKGNFPLLTPWQPDLKLAYHMGTSELLGAFYFLTNLDFQFLHLFFSAFFIVCSIQIVVWIWGRHKSLLNFIVANLAAFVTFISFGFFYLLIPNYPINLPHINNINELVIWLRNLPTVNQAIEVYGAPINLDGLIYFIFHSFGLAIFLLTAVVLINYRKDQPRTTWVILAVILASLALVNESILVVAAPALLLAIIFKERATLKKNIIFLMLLWGITFLIILFQGGMITSKNSVVIFPAKDAIKENFTSYHYYQQISRVLPIKKEWLLLPWFHVGVDWLLLLNILIMLRILRLKVKSQQLLLIYLFLAGFTSLVAYNVLVPKYLIANGNRFLSFSFLIFSLVICLYLNFIKKLFLVVLILWIAIPTIIPPLALLSKTRFGPNLLIPKSREGTAGIEWLKNNLPYNRRVVVLDSRTPHPSGMAQALVEAGVFAPLFPGDFRAYTIEASPEYFDITYFLSPAALKKLKVDTLLIDNTFFATLPQMRKIQLNDRQYFTKIFDSVNEPWEKIYQIKNQYLNEGLEIDGTFRELNQKIAERGKIYIDNEENFEPSYLRRAIIFNLRGRQLYYLPQSGVYLNVEVDIPSFIPQKKDDYAYLVLGKAIDPNSICSCQSKLIWQGLRGRVYLWQRI